MKHPSTRQLYDYWEKLRGRQPAPNRSAIEPSEISGLLGDTFILEVAHPLSFPFRLAGTRLCAAMGRELKGSNFLALWEGQDIEPLATLLTAVSTDAAAAVLGVECVSDRGLTTALEMLLLPLTQNGRRFDRILGLAVAMEAPYWLGLQPIIRQQVTSLRLIWPDERPYFLRREQLDELPAEPAKPLAPPVFHPAGRRRQHLLVLDGGKT